MEQIKVIGTVRNRLEVILPPVLTHAGKLEVTGVALGK